MLHELSSEPSLAQLQRDYTDFLGWSRDPSLTIEAPSAETRPHEVGHKGPYSIRSTYPAATHDWIVTCARLFAARAKDNVSQRVLDYYYPQVESDSTTNLNAYIALNQSLGLALAETVTDFVDTYPDERVIFGLWLALEASGIAGLMTVLTRISDALSRELQGDDFTFDHSHFVAYFIMNGSNDHDFKSMLHCPFHAWAAIVFEEVMTAIHQIGSEHFQLKPAERRELAELCGEALVDDPTLAMVDAVKITLQKVGIMIAGEMNAAELDLRGPWGPEFDEPKQA